MKRIIMHWTAGGHTANSVDKQHYHEIVEGDGTRVMGNLRPEANEDTSDGEYAAHTRLFNRYSIGLSMAGMANATHTPFSAGNHPLTKTQVDVFCTAAAEYAETYGIEITRATVLTHAEVQITHGIIQAGKWDITWLPGMKRPGDPIEVGDQLRKMIREARDRDFGSALTAKSGSMGIEVLLGELVSLLKKENA